MFSKLVCFITAGLFGLGLTLAAAQRSDVASLPVYRRSGEPVERRVDDLIRRMTPAEKVRQLDLYSGAKALVDRQSDETHAAPGASFLPDKASVLFGELGVGGIHDLYSNPQQARFFLYRSVLRRPGIRRLRKGRLSRLRQRRGPMASI